MGRAGDDSEAGTGCDFLARNEFEKILERRRDLEEVGDFRASDSG